MAVRTDSVGFSPSGASLSAGQRPDSSVTGSCYDPSGLWPTLHPGGPSSLGGSETMSHPPTRRSGAAHSATTAGAPNERATTPSKVALYKGSRPTDLGPLVHDAHPLLEGTGGHGSLEELGPALIGLEEHHGGFWPRPGDHKTRKPTA